MLEGVCCLVVSCEPWSFVGVQAGDWADTRPCMSGDRLERRSKGEPPKGRSRVGGGDPAADSPTATLLRLKPPCEAQIRLVKRASSGPHSGALTGGVCKEQGRIHRALMTRDYYRIQLHVGELQPTIRTTIEFLRLPSPFGVGTLCLDHCSPRVAQHIRGILTYRCPFLPPCWPRQSPYCPQPLRSVAGK
jgi:hypothetical protein